MTFPRTMAESVAVEARQARAAFLCFRGHRQDGASRIDRSCLSQWYASAFEHDGVRYPTAEHYMMTEKARLFDDPESARRISRAGSPGEAKSLGRQVANFDQRVRDEAAFDIVVSANCLKFFGNATLGNFLIGTGRRVLVEASPADAIWRIGLDSRGAIGTPISEWPGLNKLGFALMEVRQRLLVGRSG